MLGSVTGAREPRALLTLGRGGGEGRGSKGEGVRERGAKGGGYSVWARYPCSPPCGKRDMPAVLVWHVMTLSLYMGTCWYHMQ